MQALVYHYSAVRYLLSRGLSRFQPRVFFARLAPLRLQDIPFTLPASNWVILRNRLCGICGSDLRLLKGEESLLLEPYASFPAVLGHEAVAEVVEAPPDSPWRPGYRVAVEPVLCCEVRGLIPCPACAQGEYNLCERFTDPGLAAGAIFGFNRTVGGGMAQMMAAHPSRLVRLPHHLPDEIAVLTDSMASALQPVLDHFPQDYQTVVVYGAGMLGQHLIRLLRVLGSRAHLVAVARHPFQQELARAGGADLVLSEPSREELGQAVGARFIPTTLGGGNLEGGAHLFFDCVGSRYSLQEGLLALQRRGTYVLVATTGSLGRVDFSSLWFRELHLTGTSMFAYGLFRGRRVRTYELAVELLARGDYPVQGLVSHFFPLREYRRAFQTAYDKPLYRSMKVVFDLRE
jgi:threonine dehydrogenase-like Zn-dependent dehydrogenase